MTRLFALLRRMFAAGRGRPLAVGWLAVGVVLLFLPQYSPFAGGQGELFDRYQRVFPRERASAPVTIVDIDEASLKVLGQWPWPRNTLAALIDRIASHQPAAIGLDMYFPEADGSSPEAVAARLPPESTAAREALLALPHHDDQFARSLRAAPSVLGVAGLAEQTATAASGFRHRPVNVSGGDALSALRRFPYVLASIPALQAAARGQALLSADLEGGVVRRMPLAAAVGDSVAPGLALELLRIASGASAINLAMGRSGVEAVELAELRVPTSPDASLWLHMGHADQSRYVSAHEVLSGKADPALFSGKVVLVGLSGLGLTDVRLTPLGEHVPGMEIQAQLIESLIDGDWLQRPRAMVWVEGALLVVLGGFLIWAVPTIRPRYSTMLATALYLGLFGAGFALFRLSGFLFDAATLFASLNVVFGSLLGSVFVETDQARRHAQAALQRSREEAARVGGELDAARRIQMGSLPQFDQTFPGEQRFKIAALLEPARAVGGDLYDFFPLDERHVFFAVGDVSGKGVPASLFMAVTKALAKSIALRGPASIGEVMSQANVELARENPEMLFVTMVAGVLDIDTGRVHLCNAGHDAPWQLGAHGMRRVMGEGGPPLCMLEAFDYPAVELGLAPGDMLCLVSDGVTEAMNVAGEVYGVARLEASLAKSHATPAALVAAVREDVRAFVGEAEPSDDLTILVLRWGETSSDSL